MTTPNDPFRRNRRISAEQLLNRAAFLPRISSAIISAYLDKGMKVREIAVLHGMSPRQMRRRIDRLRDALADPCFLLATRYTQKLPTDLRTLAHAYWFEARSLREIARLRKQTLHRIRLQIAIARSLLLVSMSSDQPPE